MMLFIYQVQRGLDMVWYATLVVIGLLAVCVVINLVLMHYCAEDDVDCMYLDERDPEFRARVDYYANKSTTTNPYEGYEQSEGDRQDGYNGDRCDLNRWVGHHTFTEAFYPTDQLPAIVGTRGNIIEFTVFEHACTTSEISWLYNKGIRQRTKLVSWYKKWLRR